MPKTYEATAHREGRWWIVEVPELDAVTQARHVGEIDEMAAELVAALLDLPVGEASVAVRIDPPASAG